MAIKISQLPSGWPLAGDEELPVNQDGSDAKITPAQILKWADGGRYTELNTGGDLNALVRRVLWTASGTATLDLPAIGTGEMNVAPGAAVEIRSAGAGVLTVRDSADNVLATVNEGDVWVLSAVSAANTWHARKAVNTATIAAIESDISDLEEDIADLDERKANAKSLTFRAGVRGRYFVGGTCVSNQAFDDETVFDFNCLVLFDGFGSGEPIFRFGNSVDGDKIWFGLDPENITTLKLVIMKDGAVLESAESVEELQNSRFHRVRFAIKGNGAVELWIDDQKCTLQNNTLTSDARASIGDCQITLGGIGTGVIADPHIYDQTLSDSEYTSFLESGFYYGDEALSLTGWGDNPYICPTASTGIWFEDVGDVSLWPAHKPEHVSLRARIHANGYIGPEIGEGYLIESVHAFRDDVEMVITLATSSGGILLGSGSTDGTPFTLSNAPDFAAGARIHATLGDGGGDEPIDLAITLKRVY